MVGFDDGGAIVGHRQHERAAVVPGDIDLRPIAVFVNINDGPQRSNWDWVLDLAASIPSGCDRLSSIVSLQQQLFPFSFCSRVEFVEQFAGLSQACVDLCHR